MSQIDVATNFHKQTSSVATVFLLTFFFFALLGPVTSNLPANGLDASWGWVLSHAYISGWQWGKDIVFTFGPWGFVYAKMFHPSLEINQFIAWFTISLSLSIFIADRCEKSVLLFLSVIIFSLSMASIDALLMAVCIFPALQNSKKKAYSMPVTILYLLTASMLGLVKSTFLVIALVAVLLLDLKSFLRKKFSYYSILFIAFTLFFYIAAGQNITFFYSFIISSLDIISGYGSAMNTSGPKEQLIMFLILVLILVISAAKTVNIAEIDPRRNITLWIIAIYLFFCFKNGFVRHDNHVLTAFSGLAIAVFLIYSSYKDSIDTQWRGSFFGIVVISFFIFTHISGGIASIESRSLITLSNNFRLIDLLLSPHSWYQDNVRAFNNAKSNVQIKYPINVTGSVDVLSSNQSALIANDLNYMPRPIFQEFAVYTPSLSRINLEYFNKTPPDHFLFSAESIDSRYPNLSDGYLWPLLYKCYSLNDYITSINAYDLVSVGNNGCHQKAPPLNFLSKEIMPMGGEIKIPESKQSFIYAKLTFIRNNWGRLLGLLYKENPVIAEITYNNGDKEIGRIIPKMAENGFFIDAQLSDIDNLVDRVIGHSNRLPVQLIIKQDGFLGSGYSEIQAQFYEYPIKEIQLFDTSYAKKLIHERQLLNSLIESSAIQSPPVQRSGQNRVDSHAPSNLSLIIDSKTSKVEFEIGIREGASDKFDGVCFEASAVGDTANQKVLMSHCFSRQENAAEQIYKVSIQPPENSRQLHLKNNCSGSCNYAWAFYQNFKIKSVQ